MEKTYTIIVHRVGEKDQIRRGVDKLNSVIIPAEIKMHFAAAFEQGKMSIEVLEEVTVESIAKEKAKTAYARLTESLKSLEKEKRQISVAMAHIDGEMTAMKIELEKLKKLIDN